MILRIVFSFGLSLFLTFSSGISSAVPLSTSDPSANSPISQKNLERHSQNLDLILKTAFDFWKVDQISIGGGTARSLIQAVMTGSDFSFRDFDIIFSAGKKMSADEAALFGRELEKRGLGKLSLENLRPRPRYNPDLTGPERHKYNAGFGFFVLDPAGTEIDISIFHSEKDVSLNGIMDVDCFRVTIKKGQTLQSLVEDQEKFRQAISDPHSALEKILKKEGTPKVVHWGEVERDPGNVAIRVIRTLGKFKSLPMDVFTEQKIRSFVTSTQQTSPLQVARNLLKLLADLEWILEFQTVTKAGVFSKHFTSFEKILFAKNFPQKASVDQKLEFILKEATTADALEFLKILSTVEPEVVKVQLPKLILNHQLNTGYLTGEFAPFHKGHLSVAQTALEKGGLDLVFVLPTPHATNGAKTVQYSPVEYAERIAFVEAGLKGQSRVWVWPLHSNQSLEKKLSSVISDLEKFCQSRRPLTHVFGMDSFHRVLHRNLLSKDPRPRIAVSRPGVPVPDLGVSSSSIQVIQNSSEQAISATRILHELALNGHSADLSPAVQDLVMKTPRYQKILQGMSQTRDEIQQFVVKIDSFDGKTVIWDPRENHAGLYDPEAPNFAFRHQRVLEELKRMGAQRVHVFMEKASTAKASWIQHVGKFSGLQIVVSDDYSFIPAKDRVVLTHSGVINETLKSGYFAQSFRGQKGLIVFETPDQPLSLLISGLSEVRKIQVENQVPICRKAYSAQKAVGF